MIDQKKALPGFDLQMASGETIPALKVALVEKILGLNTWKF
jgi:hypothetical protein